MLAAIERNACALPASCMRLIDTGPEPFFEDVVNHMASICSTPLAIVVLEREGRLWINRPDHERGAETAFTAEALIAFLGRDGATLDSCDFPPGLWPAAIAPHACVAAPLVLDGVFAGLIAMADTAPRVWSQFEKNYLQRAARLVGSHFEARAALAERDRAVSELSAYQAALDQFAIVSIADTNGRIIHANDRFCAISGYARHELLGADHRILNSGSHPRAFFVDMWRRIGGGEVWFGEICNRSKSGEYYWVDSTIVPISGETSGRPEKYVSIRTDCTEKRLAQTQLAAALAALESERNHLEARVEERTAALEDATRRAQAADKAKSLFLATVSHELRTPLHQIMGYAEMVQEELADAAPDREQINQDLTNVLASSRQLLALITSVLDFSRAETGQLRLNLAPVDLRSLLDECVEGASDAAARNGNTLTLEIGADIGTLVTDHARLKQCVQSLLANAAKFTTDGAIVLTAAHTPASPGRRLRIAVADTGIGLDPEARRRLFEPFYQADQGYARIAEGAGLGLALTHRLTRLLGGELTVDSTPGQGSTFTLDFPCEIAAAS